MIGISIVIPAYNEEARIISTLNRIDSYCKSNQFDYEIIVVDDGSTDKTREVVMKLHNPKVSIISYGENKGKGFAVRTGVLTAKKSHILFSDADLSTPIEELSKFLSESADIVIGSRNLQDSKITVKQPYIRQSLGKAFPIIVEWILLLHIKDTQCGFKLFTKKAAHTIFRRQYTNGFGFDVEVLFLARKKGYVVKEVPVEWRNAVGSKVRLFRDVPRMLMDVLWIRWRDFCGCYN